MDYDKLSEAANKVEVAIRDNSSLKSVIIESSKDLISDVAGQARKSVQEFLDAPHGDKKEMVMKKALAAAMAVAKERDIITELPNTGAEIAAVIDEGLTYVKTNYQVGNLVLDACDAVDTLIDHAEARAVAVVDEAFKSGIVSKVATEGVVKLASAIPVIGPVLGPAVKRCKPIINAVIKRVEEPVRKVIVAGVRTVANFAKTTVREFANTISNKVKNFIGLFA